MAYFQAKMWGKNIKYKIVKIKICRMQRKVSGKSSGEKQ